MGLAFGIMIECDLIVAEAGTKLQVTETSRGLGASRYWGLMQFRGGAAFGTEMALTGRFFTGRGSAGGAAHKPGGAKGRLSRRGACAG
jgi:enoyl-CoA hydratase/carnithine racemase